MCNMSTYVYPWTLDIKIPELVRVSNPRWLPPQHSFCDSVGATVYFLSYVPQLLVAVAPCNVLRSTKKNDICWFQIWAALFDTAVSREWYDLGMMGSTTFTYGTLSDSKQNTWYLVQN